MTRLSTTNKVLLALGGAALSLMVIGGVALLMLRGTDSEDDLTATATTTTEPVVTTPADETEVTTTTTLLAPETTFAQGDRLEGEGGDQAGDYDGDEWHVPMKPLPPMGMASTEFDWTVVELPTAEVEGDVFVHSLTELNGRLVATVHEFDYRTDESRMIVFESTDGIQWSKLPEIEIMAGHNIDAVFPFEGGLIATGRDWQEEIGGPPPMNAFITNDGRTWDRLDMSVVEREGEMVWINGAAGDADALVLSGSREPYWDDPDGYEEPVVVFEHDGKLLELNYGTNGYLITDPATGAVLLQGDMDRIYEWGDYGMSIYDPATGEALFTSQHEDYHTAASEAYADATFGEPLVITVESDGAALTVDEFAGEVTVQDAGGELVFTGTIDALWRGRPPMFIDPDTGEAVLVVPWDVWDEEHQEMWGGDDHFYEVGWYEPDPWLLLSTDGGNSFAEVGPDATEGWFGPVFHGPDGFAVIVSRHSMEDYSQSNSLYVSSDGLEWTLAVEDVNADADWVNLVLMTEEGFVGILHEEPDNRVAVSATGSGWTPILTVDDLELTLGSAYFDQVAIGELGTIVTGNRHGWEPYEEPDRTFTKNGLTFSETYDGYLLTDASGAVVFEHRWNDEYYEEYSPAAGPGLHWGEGGIVIFAEDGTAIFAASHDELHEAFHSDYEEPEFYYEDEPMVLYRNGGEWAQVPLPEELGNYAWFSGIIVGEDSVIMSTSIEHEPVGPSDYWHSVAAILVGSPSQ